jgi:hypothetical protein
LGHFWQGCGAVYMMATNLNLLQKSNLSGNTCAGLFG